MTSFFCACIARQLFYCFHLILRQKACPPAAISGLVILAVSLRLSPFLFEVVYLYQQQKKDTSNVDARELNIGFSFAFFCCHSVLPIIMI